MIDSPARCWVVSCVAGNGTPPDTLMRLDPATGREVYRIPMQQWGSVTFADGRPWLTRWVGSHVEIQPLDGGGPREGR